MKGDIYSGETEFGKKNGYGVMKYKGGSVYSGEWRDDLWHGQGELIKRVEVPTIWVRFVNYFTGDEVDTSSVTYIGEFKDGQQSGHGVLKLTDEDFTVYEGDWLDDEMHGQGRICYPDSEYVYEGQLSHGSFCGQGRFSDEDGVYTGEFRDNERNGSGVLRFHSGDEYSGQWRDGAMHGMCKLQFVEEGATYEGEFEHGVGVGRGTLTYDDGRVERDVLFEELFEVGYGDDEDE